MNRPWVHVMLLAAALGPRAPAAAHTNTPAAPGSPGEFGFPVGEELLYKVYWGVLPVGTCVVTTEWVEQDGQRLVLIRYRTQSNRVIASIYPVDDTIEALIDPRGWRPVRFTKDMHEGRLHFRHVTTFDFARGVARWTATRRKGDREEQREAEIAIGPDTRDLVTFMYGMRRHRFVPGTRETFRVLSDQKIYDLVLTAEAEEEVKLPELGRAASVRIEPEASFDGLFVRKGRLWLWVSQDERRVCTQLAGEVPVAKVRVKLAAVRGPGDDAWIRRTREAEQAPPPAAPTRAAASPDWGSLDDYR